MSKTNIVLGIAILAVVLLGIVIYSRTNTFGGIVEFQKKSFTQGFFAGDGRQIEVDKEGGLYVSSSTVRFGNLDVITDEDDFNTASTTMCSKPITATSSINKIITSVTTATNTAVTITYATSTANSNASTTILYQFVLAANKLGAHDWAPTSTDKSILSPGDNFNITVTGFRPNSSETSLFLGKCGFNLFELK